MSKRRWLSETYVKRTRAKKQDNYPHLRSVNILRLSPEDVGLGPNTRRARLISKALLRAQRRWDAYGLIVSLNALPWEKSKKTKEWRLIIQNLRLLRGLRRLSIYTPERGEEVVNVDDGVNWNRRRISMPYVQPPRTTRYTGRLFTGE